MPRVERSIDIKASPAQVLNVITDFEHYPKFVPNMQGAEILEIAGPRQRVRFTLNLIKRIRYTLDLTTIDDTGLDWTLVDGPFKHNDGQWRLDDLGDGTTRASYSIDAELKGFLPRVIEKQLVAQSLPATLGAFRDEAEAHG